LLEGGEPFFRAGEGPDYWLALASLTVLDAPLTPAIFLPTRRDPLKCLGCAIFVDFLMDLPGRTAAREQNLRPSACGQVASLS